MNFQGFLATLEIVKGAAAGLNFNEANCPDVDAATSGVLVAQLAGDACSDLTHTDQTACEGASATWLSGNTFEGATVGSLVIELDKSLVSSTDNPIIGVTAATHAAQ